MTEKETHKDILDKLIKSHQESIDKANAELAKLDEPKLKLRHGDYGHDVEDFICLGQDIYWLDCGGKAQGTFESFINKNTEVFGNIVDDLKRNGEDLRRFELGGNSYGFNSEGLASVQVYIAGTYHTIDEAVQFHKDFGQMLATAQREAKKNE